MTARRYRLRTALNVANTTTVWGLLVARIGGAEVRRGPRGMWLATGYRPRFPRAAAFCVGNVVLSRHTEAQLLARPQLLAHEERHSWQYALLGGLPYWPAYVLAMGWSMVRTGDRGAANVFEQAAGLADGGYPTGLPRRGLRDLLAVTRRPGR